MKPYDLILVGAGLANSLIAYRLTQVAPQLRIRLIEQDAAIGGLHTWSFHRSDVSESAFGWITPLVSAEWAGHEVSFPGFTRHFSGPYLSIRSEHFRQVISQALGARLHLGLGVEQVRADGVGMSDGTWLPARSVLDGRGFSELKTGSVGFQKFIGLDLRLTKDHGLAYPILMDATCEQKDGFRFFYVLPWSAKTVLIEDTHYSDHAEIGRTQYREDIYAFAARKGWTIESEIREEIGILPIPLENDFSPLGASSSAMRQSGIPTSGTRAGLFHPTTGYSFAEAVRLAETLANHREWSTASLLSLLQSHAKRHEARGRFFRYLNRMLFRGCEPQSRVKVLEMFYRLPESAIARFYSGHLSLVDYFRILSHPPPIPITEAWRCFFERKGNWLEA